MIMMMTMTIQHLKATNIKFYRELFRLLDLNLTSYYIFLEEKSILNDFLISSLMFRSQRLRIYLTHPNLIFIFCLKILFPAMPCTFTVIKPRILFYPQVGREKI